MTGARVGNWYLEAEIGRGAAGAVYRARDYDDPDRRAAVKVFTAPGTQEPAFVQSFAAEMLPLQRLDHVNVAKFYDSGTHGGLAFVACELVEGADCARALEAGRRPWREVLSVAVQAARALKHAHNRNVLHRDLKPAHFMLTADGTLKVLGFGLAKVVPPVTAAGPPVPIGSAAYAPPEVASGKPLTRRSDFYALGGVLYTLATGRPPFAAATQVELMHKQCYTLPERPGMLVPDLPAELDEFLCVLLDKNPARRPATAAAVLEELERIRGKLERKGEAVEWPAKVTPDTAEAAALPALGGDRAGDEPEPRTRPLLSRPLVVFPALALVAAALVAAFAWPGPTAAELYSQARPLLESDDPDDWERAVAEYLDPLSQKYPDRYTEEVAAARTKVRDRRDLRRAIAEGARADPQSDAERAYLRGLRLAQAGDPDAARRTWRAVAEGFGPVAAEARWVDLARAGLAALDKPEARGTRPPPDRAGLRAALDDAKRLPPAERTACLRALADLYRDDPAALDLIRPAADGK
ncbi:serine threonine protein kinase : Probable serine/threonine-protein kinase pknA OS=Planctomyces maris DSM 8797 GN=PM8797T_06787 PE=4 SV=1: Pkinase [Gemmataceae bacterium]|nr:serine threonine protein kinase : Probable serine/threonine-protein kinase pknA OS=Planctomyces maris DSM 8797 GN=PM8797T_06787 PE=4 SV=1: Pkinase [Gemmataceae bacterium]VTU01231.1 serine threonine protein kinase : Probable serine/threonine-protein kinase pknA OS=Planctomyces maris DSM 8797 GN=PM8797T_06787 PE=4 SV=1: Pkinase [Gemmataceae bacterium]